MNVNTTIQTVTGMLIFSVALISPLAAVANSTDYYEQGFGDVAVGTPATDLPGWSAGAVDDAVVAEWDFIGEGLYLGVRPIPSATDTNVLRIENNVTNSFTSGQVGITNWIDNLIKPIFWEEDEYPGLIADAQMAYFVNSNGTLVVMHSEYDAEQFTLNNEWVEITDLDPLGTNEWIRVTVEMNYADLDEVHFTFTPFYRIYVNGMPATHDEAFVSPNRSAARGGAWFGAGENAPAQGEEGLREVAIHGTGYIDDLVVRTTSPFTVALVRLTATRGGTITPVGDLFIDIPSSTNISLAVSNYWSIADLVVDTESKGAQTDWTLDVVDPFHSVEAIFAANNTDGVPHWWLNARGIADEDFATAVTNRLYASKPLTIGDEYWVSTNPDDPDSLFQIASVGITNGMPYVRWASPTFDPDLDPFRIYRSINVADTNNWTLERSEPRQAAENIWIDESAPTNAVFYQIRVNSAP